MYSVEFGPVVNMASNMEMSRAFRALREVLLKIYGRYFPSDRFIFSTTHIQDAQIFHGHLDGQQFEVKIVPKMTIDLDELSKDAQTHLSAIMNFFNMVVRSALREKKYQQVGRFPIFFLAEDKIKVDRHNLWAWPGYEVQVKQSEQGIFLNIESRTKFINTDTVLTQFQAAMNYGDREADFFEQFNSSNIDNPRKVVITSHNSKSYQVDGMTDKFSPDTYTFQKRDGTQVTMTKYFHEMYSIKLRPKQPFCTSTTEVKTGYGFQLSYATKLLFPRILLLTPSK